MKFPRTTTPHSNQNASALIAPRAAPPEEMNSNLAAVVKHFKPVPKLTHRQTVMRLYRRSLRLINSWAESRALFNAEATKVRAQFDANKHHPADSGIVKRLIREANEKMLECAHPDPVIAHYMPGGASFMRNPAIPLEVCYPDGIPAGYSKRRVNIDFSNIPDDQEFADKVFVDSGGKTYWIDK